MTDIFDEIDEGLRKDQAKEVWTRYRWLIILLASLIIGIVAAYNYYNHMRIQKGEDATMLFTQTMLQLNGSGDSNKEAGQARVANALKQDIENNLYAGGVFGQGLNYIAKMSFAGLSQELKDYQAATPYYEAIAVDESLKDYERNLARFMAVRSAYLAGAPLEELKVNLEVLSKDLVSISPVLYGQTEILRAELSLAMGQKLQATNILIGLRDDPNSDAGIRGLSNEFIDLLDIY